MFRPWSAHEHSGAFSRFGTSDHGPCPARSLYRRVRRDDLAHCPPSPLTGHHGLPLWTGGHALSSGGGAAEQPLPDLHNQVLCLEDAPRRAPDSTAEPSANDSPAVEHGAAPLGNSADAAGAVVPAAVATGDAAFPLLYNVGAVQRMSLARFMVHRPSVTQLAAV